MAATERWPPWHALLLALAGMGVFAPRRAVAQLYQFEDTPAPEARSLHTMYAFYVYSHADAPERSMGQPFVKFHKLLAHSTSASRSDQDLAQYHGLQLTFLPFQDFWTLINPNKFCSVQADVEAGKVSAADQLLVQTQQGSDPNVYTHTLQFGTPAAHTKDVEVPVRFTGVYILAFSNCGTFAEATVTGSVVVKNAYGFLPGNEYHKMPFYGWLSLGYTLLGVVWFGLSLRYWRDLFHIQNCISGVIFLGLVEAFLWWIFFNDWNSTGNRGKMLFTFAILSTVLKSIFSYMLVLVAALGWGVTRPYLDQRTIAKIQAISVLYIILDFIRETVLSFRHSHTLSLTFVLLCLLPVSLLNGGIFYWIFTALSGLIEQLRERRQMEKLALFQNLSKLLVLAMGTASIMLLWQIFDLSKNISVRWHYQWIFADGFSHVLFLVVLSVMMYLWRPSANSKSYAYSQQLDSADPDQKKGATSWPDEEGLDADDAEEDDDSFWATTRSSVPASKLGAASAGDVELAD
eukprot:TRINITY_DN54687_c0_g1_i1.p1 TRINITY_DN54687_c0_g1~~TRINITY_DN54687_c0_g1_i1.p1  ORF type:complete len:543 (-),score=96.07 TRINITY_DN54687_c0_g1_i1:48-1601(-)